MMALLDVLRERTERRTRSAQVSCGELGLLSVEALPPAELERLSSDRAVLYAACRELQRAGEALRQAGKLFAPDEITAYLSDEEAASGAAAVRNISGVSASRRDPGTGVDTAGGEADPAAAPRMTGPDTGPDSPASPADRVSGGTENGEIRLDTVQVEPAVLPSNAGHGPADFGGVMASAPVLPRTENREIRLDAVQASGSETTKVRHDPVQTEAPADRENPALLPQNRDGQDSREFCPEPFQPGKTDKKAQGIVDLPGWNTRNLGETHSVPSGEKSEDRRAKAARLPHETESEIPEGMHETASEFSRFRAGAVHEITSDFQDGLHETTSEQSGFGKVRPHEIKSEFREALHETESESGGTMAETLHEMTSESPVRGPGRMHETRSESGAPAQESVHEIRSEVREAVHEMESELTDRVARSILEGLRRAAAVR